jgi:AraC-like DNA-binding protein
MLRNKENFNRQLSQQHRGLEISQRDLTATKTHDCQSSQNDESIIFPQKFHHHPEPPGSPIFSRDRQWKLLISARGFDRLHSIYLDAEHVPTIHCSSFGNFQLVNLEWRSTFTIQQDPVDGAYMIYVPFSGDLDRGDSPQTVDRFARGDAMRTNQTATLINPDQSFTGISSETGQGLLIWIDRQLIEEVLETLLDRSLKQPLLFDRTIDLTSEFGISLQKFVQFLGLHRDPAQAVSSSLVQTELERALLTCLLKGSSNNYADEILYRTHGAFACYVTKARLFIESHLHEDLKLADIATAAGICPRLLQKAFSEHCGCSPMRILNQTRLQRIRQELERSSINTRIVDVMMCHGFTQGGKFAKEYQQLFGEKPSDTLKRSSHSHQSEFQLWHEIDDRQSAQVSGGVQTSPGDRLIKAAIPNLTGFAKFDRGASSLGHRWLWSCTP